jgi:2-keto-3-deoxy-L-rhamnonate aldolase RhmA
VSLAEPVGFRRRLRAGELTLGALVAIPDPAVASILGRSGYDFVVLDAEHGPFTLDSLRRCVEALDATAAAAIVRVAANDPTLIKQALDLGIDAVQVPTVSSGAEAEALVRASRYPPEGRRGMGFGRASGYGVDLARSVQEANAATAVIAMIEDVEGVEEAAAIAASGVDAIVVGPFDLSGSLGVPGEAAHPSVAAATARVVAAARAAGIAVGTVCAPAEVAARVAEGMTLLTMFADSLGLAAAAQESLRGARVGAA